jgi:WD40 repeat protein
VVVPTGRNAVPVWSADGATIFFAAARDELPFQIFSVSIDDGTIRRLDGTGVSAQSPAISPDGRSLVYVGYTADGYDLFSIPLTSAHWTPVPPASDSRPTDVLGSTEPPLPSQTYSPRRTILPHFWTPTLESDERELVVGAATGSLDALARHAYGAEAGWTTSRARPDWQIAYAYDRFRPTFFAAVSDDTDPWFDGERRLVEADAGMLLVSRRIRWSQSVLAELHTSKESFECTSVEPRCAQTNGVSVRRTAGRTGLAFDSRRMFGFSISPEEGGAVAATFEYARSPSSGSPSSTSATVDARRYLRAWPRHAAIAVRAAGAASWGDVGVRRVFSASGSEPQPGGFHFGSDAIGLIRGLDEDRVFGFRAAVINIDYRVPIAHPERGLGTLPLLLRAIHTAAFFDAGRAWPDPTPNDGVRYSLGAELSVDTVLGYFAPLTFSGGAAWRGGPVSRDRGLAAFVRVGRAF